jgi:hypothetical protein
MLVRIAACAALMLCAWAAPAAATVYSRILSQTLLFNQQFTTTSQYTGNTGNVILLGAAPVFSINKFNATGSKGQALTLTSVRISVDRALTGDISLVNGSGNARSGSLQFEMTSTLSTGSLFTLADQAGNATIAINIPKQSQGDLGFANINTTASNVFTPSSFTPYIGNDTISVTHNISNFLSSVLLTSGGSGSLSGTASGSVSGNLTVEYHYLDPVPEPASWLMLVTGFGLAGAVSRRQRALGHA